MTIEQIKQLANLALYSDYEIQQEVEKKKKEYPKKPVKPYLKDKHTPDDVLEYAEKLKQYEKDIVEYNAKYEEIYEYNYDLNTTFEEYLKEKSGLLDFDEKLKT